MARLSGSVGVKLKPEGRELRFEIVEPVMGLESRLTVEAVGLSRGDMSTWGL